MYDVLARHRWSCAAAVLCIPVMPERQERSSDRTLSRDLQVKSINVATREWAGQKKVFIVCKALEVAEYCVGIYQFEIDNLFQLSVDPPDTNHHIVEAIDIYVVAVRRPLRVAYAWKRGQVFPLLSCKVKQDQFLFVERHGNYITAIGRPTRAVQSIGVRQLPDLV